MIIITLIHQRLYVSVATRIVNPALVLLKINVQVVMSLYTLNPTNVIILPVHMVSM